MFCGANSTREVMMKSVKQSESPVKPASSAGGKHQPPNAGGWIKLGDLTQALVAKLGSRGK